MAPLQLTQVSVKTAFPALEEQLVLAAPPPGGTAPPAGFLALGGAASPGCSFSMGTAPSLEGQLATEASSSLPQHAWGRPLSS